MIRLLWPSTGSQGTAPIVSNGTRNWFPAFLADPCHCSAPSLAPTIFVVLICPRCAHSCLNFVPMVRWNAVFTPSPLAPGVCCVGHKPWCPRVIIPDPPLVSRLPRLPSVCFFLLAPPELLAVVLQHLGSLKLGGTCWCSLAHLTCTLRSMIGSSHCPPLKIIGPSTIVTLPAMGSFRFPNDGNSFRTQRPTWRAAGRDDVAQRQSLTACVGTGSSVIMKIGCAFRTVTVFFWREAQLSGSLNGQNVCDSTSKFEQGPTSGWSHQAQAPTEVVPLAPDNAEPEEIENKCMRGAACGACPPVSRRRVYQKCCMCQSSMHTRVSAWMSQPAVSWSNSKL